MITNDARFSREIESRIAMTKAGFNQKGFFHQQIGLKLWEVLHLENNFVWCRDFDTVANKAEMRWKFLHVVLEKDGDQLDTSYDKINLLEPEFYI